MAEMEKKLEIGERGKNAAVRFLERFGYEVLDRDYGTPEGTVDIVARDLDTLVFCSVITRTGIEQGFPAETTSAAERARREKAAAWYLKDYDEVDVPVRFDLIALLVVAEDRAFVKHYCNVFGANYC